MINSEIFSKSGPWTGDCLHCRDYLKVLAVTASNTWGLSLLVLLLGYGLIDVPRSCWHSARLRQRLARTYFSLAKMSLERAEAEETLEDVLDVSRNNVPFSGTTRVSRYQRGKTKLDFAEARDNEWQWHQLGCMQVCTLLQTDNHASTPPLLFFTGRMPLLLRIQQRQSTEGSKYILHCVPEKWAP